MSKVTPCSLFRYGVIPTKRNSFARVDEGFRRGFLQVYFYSGQSTRCCLNTITDTFSQNATDVLAYLPNGKSFLVLVEFVYAVSQLCAYRSPSLNGMIDETNIKRKRVTFVNPELFWSAQFDLDTT